MCVAVRGKSTPRTADVIVTKIAGYVRVRILMNSDSFVYLALIVLHYGHFVEYMNMHVMNMQLTAMVGAARVT